MRYITKMLATIWRMIPPYTTKWIGLTLVLILISLGPIGFVCLFVSILCFLVGVCAIIYQQGGEELHIMKHQWSDKISPTVSTGLFSYKMQKMTKRFDGSLTGSEKIDYHLRECLKYMTRDYVKCWYYDVSDDPEFNETLDNLLADVIQSIAIRCKNVDWQTYLTQKLVDDFASHLRLFRKAQEGAALLKKHNGKSEQDTASLTSTSSSGSEPKTEKTMDEQIIDLFFDCEIDIEKTCRDLVSCDREKQTECLRTTTEVLLYMLLPKSDFHSRPLKYLFREIIVNGILHPLLDLLSDPDYINQYISWMISDNCLLSDAFLSVLRHSRDTREVEAIQDKVKEEITKICAQDTVGNDPVVKQQLGSLQYVHSTCEHIVAKQASLTESSELDSISFGKPSALYNLPLDVSLRNNIALQFFIEYMQSIEQQAYLFFWLTVEGYRVSAEQQLNALKIQQLKGEVHGTPDIEMLRTIGRNIYEQYLRKSSTSYVELDANSDREILRKLNNEEPSPHVFDDIQKAVFSKMQRDENLYPAFKTTQQYVKLLAELDLLREPSIQSEDTFPTDEESVDEDNYKLVASITTTCICTEHGKSYAMFAISAIREQYNANGDVLKTDRWDTFRRYSDFAYLHDNLKITGCDLSNLKLPGKSIFKGLSDEFIQKRRTDLNAYLQTVLELERSLAVVEAINTFLDAKTYKRQTKTLSKRVDLMRSSMKIATDSFKGSMLRASDKVSDGFKNISQKRITLSANGLISVRQNDNTELYDNCRVSEQIENIEENIPLRIVLLLMDEVFDLKQRNQWFRRQVVAALQQFIRTLFGDRMNRKIVDYVNKAVSPEQVAEYIIRFSNSFWPSGMLAEKLPERDEECKMRTRMLTKSKLLGAIPDEIRPLVGSETCHRGVMRVFQMFQYPQLNTRLIIILIEGVLNLLFPTNNFPEVFKKLHAESPKLQERKREERRRNNRN